MRRRIDVDLDMANQEKATLHRVNFVLILRRISFDSAYHPTHYKESTTSSMLPESTSLESKFSLLDKQVSQKNITALR
jgi:hypothetical protein